MSTSRRSAPEPVLAVYSRQRIGAGIAGLALVAGLAALVPGNAAAGGNASPAHQSAVK